MNKAECTVVHLAGETCWELNYLSRRCRISYQLHDSYVMLTETREVLNVRLATKA